MAYAIKKGSDYFTTVLYTGDNIANRTISVPTLTPDFTWIKARNTADTHVVYDTVRQGLVGPGSRLRVDSTDAESDLGDYVELITNGFKVTTGVYNNTGVTYAAWNWKAGGTAVTNTDGDITTTVSANPTAGFSIVTYTGTDTITDTIGHGLGTTPEMMILRSRSTGSGWYVYHKAMGNGKFMYLNTTQAEITSGVWNNTSPTSTVFVTGAKNAGVTGVAYCFASVKGYSKFGSYTGNGSSDGTFVYTGFRPAYVLVKNSTTAGLSWVINDTTRDTYNECNKDLITDSSSAESNPSPGRMDILSNGFKLRSSANSVNQSNANHIYMAFAETPFKYANAR